MGQGPLRSCGDSPIWSPKPEDKSHGSSLRDGHGKVTSAWHGVGHSLPEAIAANAAAFGSKVFAEDSNGTVRTFEELHWRVCALSTGLLDLCFAKGDRILVHSPNRVELIEVYAACAQLGVICVPTWSGLSSHELSTVLRDTVPRLVITAPQLCNKVDSARRELPFDVSTMAFGARQPLGKLSYEATIKDAAISCKGDWARVIARRKEIGLNSAWVILYGSGSRTTRGAVRTQSGMVNGYVQQVQLMGLTHQTRALVSHPLASFTGLFYATLWCYVGASSYIHDLEVEGQGVELLGKVSQHSLNFLVIAPGYFSRMLSVAAEVWEKHSKGWGSVHTVLLVGAATQPGLAAWAHEAMPHVRLFCTYETREAGVVSILSQGHGRIRSDELKGAVMVGREPIGNKAVKVMDAEDKEMSRGQVGEIWAATPNMFEGYWADGEWKPMVDSAANIGYVRTGDLGFRDSSGHLVVMSRIDEGVCLPVGIAVYPNIIAEQFKSWHTEVEEAAVLVLERGDMVAVMVLAQAATWEDTGGVEGDGAAERARRTLKEVAGQAAQELAWYQRPVQMVVVKNLDFPLDDAGMPDTQKLIALLERGSLHACALASVGQ